MTSTPVSSRRAFIACCAANCVANATWWMQPIIVEQLLTKGGMSFSQTGLTVSVEMIMLSLFSVVAARIMVGSRFLTVAAWGTVAAVGASVASLLTGNYIAYLLLRAMVGAATGLVLMAANAGLTQLGDADRNFTRMTLLTVLFGMLLVFFMPYAPQVDDHPSSLVVLAGTVALMIPLVLLMPAALRLPAPQTPAADIGPGVARGRGLWALYMLAPIIAIASGIMWAFYGVIGTRAGLSAQGISEATATSIFASLGGIMLGTALAGRIDRRTAIICGLLVMAGAIAALALLPDPLAFRVATCANVAAIVFIMPFIFAAAAAKDASGRAAAVANSAFFFGGAVAPFIGGILAQTVGVTTMGTIAVSLLSLGLLLYLLGDRGKGEAGQAALA